MARANATAKNGRSSSQEAQYMAESPAVEQDLALEGLGSDAPRFQRALPDFDADLMSRLVDYLTELGATLVEDRSTPVNRLVRFEGPQRDRLAFRRFSNGTLQLDGGVQGQLANWTVDFLRTVMPLDRVLAQQVEIYRLPVSVAEIKGLLAVRAPTADMVLSEPVRIQLSSALAMSKIDIALEDYAVLAFPALRGLEGFCFQVLRDECRFNPTSRHRLGDYFEADGAGFGLRPIYADAVSPAQRLVLSRCYDLWHGHRHGLFHMDGVLEITQVIADRARAIALVNEVLSMIDDSCQRLLKGRR